MGLTKFPNGISSFGNVIHGNNLPYPGKVYHVRKTTDKYYTEWASQMDHQYWDGSKSVQLTITAALAVADDFDTIWVYPGEWIEAGTLSITQDYLRLLAACGGPFHAREGTALWQLGGSEVPVITIDGAHGVEVAGFGRIIPYNSAAGVGISIGETTECKGTWIHDNSFYAIEGSPGPTHIVMGASTKEAQYTLIENNWFYCGGDHTDTTGMIDWVHATRSTIRNNVFQVQSNHTGMAGIYIHDELYIRGQILDNKFWAMEQTIDDSVSYAIKAEAAFVGGDMCITGNEFVNFSAPLNDIDENALGINYETVTALAVD